ncbi:kelch-like protein 40b [Drosophila obscura]|uniref:kelch-like protein 40b n=1 Tax=Drosophila obscura TaxID=7282 RepID=UPI001BB1E6A7|nr:kelch-like protein 40b [Drosophila obscura]
MVGHNNPKEKSSMEDAEAASSSMEQNGDKDGSESSAKSVEDLDVRSSDEENIPNNRDEEELQSVPTILERKTSPKTKLATFVPTYEATQDMWSSHRFPVRESLAQSLMHSIEKKKVTSDLVVVVEDKRFECHRMFLEAISKFFRELEPREEYHLSPHVISAHDFGILYHWPFDGKDKDKDYIGLSSLLNIVKAAEFFGCEYLLHKCWGMLEIVTSDSFNVMVLCGCSNDSVTLNSSSINKILIARMAEGFLQFVASSEFVSLQPPEVRSLFKNGYLWVNSELEVLMAAIVWLNHNWPQRARYIGFVVEVIRFHEIPLHSLITFAKRCDGPPALRAVAQSEDFKKLERMALIVLQKSPQQWQGRTGIARKWIYDQKAGYHHRLTCVNQKFWGYNMFADYLIFLQTAGISHCSTLLPCDDPSIVCCPPRVLNSSESEF